MPLAALRAAGGRAGLFSWSRGHSSSRTSSGLLQLLAVSTSAGLNFCCRARCPRDACDVTGWLGLGRCSCSGLASLALSPWPRHRPRVSELSACWDVIQRGPVTVFTSGCVGHPGRSACRARLQAAQPRSATQCRRAGSGSCRDCHQRLRAHTLPFRSDLQWLPCRCHKLWGIRQVNSEDARSFVPVPCVLTGRWERGGLSAGDFTPCGLSVSAPGARCWSRPCGSLTAVASYPCQTQILPLVRHVVKVTVSGASLSLPAESTPCVSCVWVPGVQAEAVGPAPCRRRAWHRVLTQGRAHPCC